MEFDDSLLDDYNFDLAPATSAPQSPPTQSTELTTDKDDPPVKVKRIKLDEAL